jgi:hypothetical protein
MNARRSSTAELAAAGELSSQAREAVIADMPWTLVEPTREVLTTT